jgi:hypothetical protein
LRAFCARCTAWTSNVAGIDRRSVVLGKNKVISDNIAVDD